MPKKKKDLEVVREVIGEVERVRRGEFLEQAIVPAVLRHGFGEEVPSVDAKLPPLVPDLPPVGVIGVVIVRAALPLARRQRHLVLAFVSVKNAQPR